MERGGSKYQVTGKVAEQAWDFLANNSTTAIDQLRGLISTFEYDPNYAARIAEWQLIIEALGGE
jgi:hypothetical protein